MPVAPLDGTRLSWTGQGAGEAILFLHGFPFDARLWSGQLAALPAGWRGVAPDLRGFGTSPVPAALTVEAHAADAFALLDHLGVEQAVVCGLSMGGYIALAMQRSAPRRIRALILADTRAEPDSDESRRQRMRQAETVRQEGADGFIAGMLPKLLAANARPEIARAVEQMMRDTPPATITATLAALAERPDARPQLPHIRVPVLVMGGREDAITPPATLEGLARAIPGAALALLDGAGHVSCMEAGAAFNAALHRFLHALG
jgi:pimeloyl-ACP methyl ester carboxylesterase